MRVRGGASIGCIDGLVCGLRRTMLTGSEYSSLFSRLWCGLLFGYCGCHGGTRYGCQSNHRIGGNAGGTGRHGQRTGTISIDERLQSLLSILAHYRRLLAVERREQTERLKNRGQSQTELPQPRSINMESTTVPDRPSRCLDTCSC